jgi:hypothetical protein
MGDDDKDVYIDIDDLYLDYPEYSDLGTDYAKDLGNITIDTSVFTNNNTISISGAGTSGSTITSNGTGSAAWSTYPYASTSAGLHVDSDAHFEGDIMWQGRSLGKLLEKIESRLAILDPDLEKLEHFAALKKAYDNYKMLEALCEMPAKEQDD